MPIKKKKKAPAKSQKHFLEAAKIAAELEKKISNKPKSVVSVSKSAKPRGAVTKTFVTQTVVERTPYSPAPKTSSLHGRNLEVIGNKANSAEELVGFNDLEEERWRADVKRLDSAPSGLIEMVGGAAMILILAEVLVLIIILIVMFFLK